MSKRNGQGIVGFLSVLFSIAIILLFNIFHLSIQYSFIFILACIIFAVAFVNTDFALIILILSMLLSPEIKVGGVSGRPVVVRIDDILLLVIFFGWLAKMAIYKQLSLLKTTVLNSPILIYILLCFLSTLLGIIQGHTEIKRAFFYLLKYVEYFLLFFMVVNNLKTIKQVRIFVFFIFLTCFLVCLYAWSQIPTAERLSAPFEGEAGEPNTFAGYLLLIMAIILGLILHAESQRQGFLLLGLLGFTLVPFVFTLSRGGWLGFFPMFLTFIVINKRFRHHLVIIFIVMIILLPHVAPQRVHRRVKETFIPGKTYTLLGRRVAFSDSASDRIESWRLGFQKWSKQPIFGYGVPSAHVVDNQYTVVLTETGLIGFIAFAWIMVTVYRLAWQVYKSVQGNNFAQGLSLGFIAGFVGLLTQALTAANFIIVRIMEPFWFLTAIIIMLPSLTKEVQLESKQI